MNLEELEEALEEIFPNGFQIETDNKGQVIVYTGLRQEEDGELVDMDEESEEEDPDFEPYDDGKNYEIDD